jgi:plasmid stability protein
MTALTIRDVPDDMLNVLKVRAAQAGKSLQAYALEVLTREASRPTLAEAVRRARAATTAEVSTDDVLSALDEARSGR